MNEKSHIVRFVPKQGAPAERQRAGKTAMSDRHQRARYRQRVYRRYARLAAMQQERLDR